MKITTEHHHQNVLACWSAIDQDTYDGAPDAGSPVGWGHTEMDAVNDLVEQIVEELEEKIDDLRWQNRCLRAEITVYREGNAEMVARELNLANRRRLEGNPPETSRTAGAGDLQIQKEYQDQAPESEGQESPCSELPPRFMGRSPDEPPEWDSGYDEPSPDR